MKSVFYAGAGIQRVLFFLNDGDLSVLSPGVGSFSADRPLGWDPAAAGSRAGDGMARFRVQGEGSRHTGFFYDYV